MEHRRTQRFALHLPLSVVRSGLEEPILAGQTNNISTTGVLFTTAQEPTLSGAIEYVIALRPNQNQPLKLRCMGKVLRLEQPGDGHAQGAQAYRVAATLERYEFVRA